MNALFLAVILLFFILCIQASIQFKEGYYSDSYTNASATSISSHLVQLNTLKTNLKQVATQELSLDAQSKLNPLLHPPNEIKYSSGIVAHAQTISKRISNYQDRLIQLKSTIQDATETPVHFKEGDLPLNDAIDSLIDEANSILTQLNQIPDS